MESVTDEVTPTREQCIEWLYRKLPQMNPTINALTKATIAHLRAPRVEAGDEEACSKRDDGQHCNCWYDGEPCCACGAPKDESDETEKLLLFVENLHARDPGWSPYFEEMFGKLRAALAALSRRPSEAVDGARGDVADEDVRALLKYAQDNPRALFADLIAKVCGALLSRTAAPSRRLTGAEREALDYAARVCDMHAQNADGAFRPLARCKAIGGYRDTLRSLAARLAGEDGDAVSPTTHNPGVKS